MWSDHTRTRSHEAVLRWVEAELAARRLRVGDRLPAERAFAELLGVSRPSVREGLRILETLGAVRTAAGSGPDAGAIVTADMAKGLTSALRLHLATDHVPLADVVRTRILLESWTVKEAAARRDEAALAAAQDLLHRMAAPRIEAEDFLRLDVEFHAVLAGAAGNVLVAAVMASLRGAIEAYVLAGVPRVDDWPALAARLHAEHGSILRAVEAGHGEDASERVVRHIEGFYTAARLTPDAG